MGWRLPPLNGVRAFEAAARHRSFTRAAAELSVTQAAVSQQVRRLEDWLSVRLFHRRENSLELTEAGRIYLPLVSAALAGIADATAQIAPGRATGVLTVSTTPSFAAKWLTARLPGFTAAHPDIDVNVTASLHRVDLEGGEADCAVRWGQGGWEGLACDRLFAEDSFPVCSPALRDGPPGLRTLDDLRRQTLLHDQSLAPWRDWLRAVGMQDVDWVRGPRVSDSSLTIQAAVEGQGVALVVFSLVADDLAAGRLVRPLDLSVHNQASYHFVATTRALRRPIVRAFRDWIVAAAAETVPAPLEPVAPPRPAG
ncbi:transcriptional regulator GcvA [Inquilinus limosus]|uniref:transcriptional regulator GcvA n=1 Tax=Inquilinus limosus TaxID=171674 RepID=UPI00041032AD|nr:transcriptional regulator GcvA [Inquilinus limosus]